MLADGDDDLGAPAAAELLDDLVGDPEAGGVAAVGSSASRSLTSRSSRWTVTVSPCCLSTSRRSAVFIGSLWRPSPSAMNELWNATPSTVPRTFTRPRVPKYAADSGHTT